MSLFGNLTCAIELKVQHTIQTATGQTIPVNRVRAGKCLHIPDWLGGGYYWIYKTRYTVADDTLFISLIPTVDPTRGVIQNARIGLDA